ncbi:MAG TPA: DMT family transporter [Ktedonobacterales bacterium]|nr:DMT family transporter [Ktedonobacterales bacterium]
MTRRGWLLFIAMSLIWGIPYLFIKIAVRELDPVVVVCARAMIGAAVLLPLAASQQMLRPLLRHWRMLVLFSLIHMAGSFVLITYGEQHVSSSLASLLIAANPLLVALLAQGFQKSERINGPRLGGLLLGFVGLIVLLGFDVGGDGQQWLGAALLLTAALGYAISALLLKRQPLADLPRQGIAAAECSVTTLVLLPVALSRLPGKVPSPEAIGSLLVLGLICTALALPIFFALIKEVGASRGTVISYVNPAVSVALGVIVLGEPLTIATVAGFLLIIAGSWLSTTGSIPFKLMRRAAKPEAPTTSA